MMKFQDIFAVFIWTLTSFACHFFAKQFLLTGMSLDVNSAILTITLTAFQLSSCLLLTNFSTPLQSMSRRRTVMIMMAHSAAALMTNASMAVMSPASTFAVKLTEPLTSALAQRFYLGEKIRSTTYLALPVIVIGSLMFIDDETRSLTLSLGGIMAFVSNIFFAARNVFIKEQQYNKNNLTTQTKKRWLVVFSSFLASAFFLIFEEHNGTIPEGSLKCLCFLLFSAIFHVIYSFVSTAVVLERLSVVGHAIANIFKRVCVVLLLYSVGRRSASLWNFFGLVVCITGLSAYILSKRQDSTTPGPYFGEICHFLSILKMPAVSAVHVGVKDWSMDRVSEWLDSCSLGDLTHNFQGVKITQMTFGLSSAGLSAVLFYFIQLSVVPPSLMAIPGGFDGPIEIRPTHYNIHPEYRKLFTWLQSEFHVEEKVTHDFPDYNRNIGQRSRLLTKNQQVIDEAQRIQVELFRHLLSGYKYVMLLGIPAHENKGDSAIAVGELYILRRLKLEVIFHCAMFHCQHIGFAKNLSTLYSNSELVILLHGGGNIIGWSGGDIFRSEVLKIFPNFEIIMFPQSIWITLPAAHIKFCQQIYSNHSRLTFVYRDRTSFVIGKQLFPKVRPFLAPDMAFQIGYTHRFMPPTHDILWIRRGDKESRKYTPPKNIGPYSVQMADWLGWSTPNVDSVMESPFIKTANGMMFLQQGRIVITDRLHGHIVSTLLGIPHILIDPTSEKISSYFHSWTQSLDNVIFVNSSDEALIKAAELLHKFDNDLPKVIGYPNSIETPTKKDKNNIFLDGLFH